MIWISLFFGALNVGAAVGMGMPLWVSVMMACIGGGNLVIAGMFIGRAVDGHTV